MSSRTPARPVNVSGATLAKWGRKGGDRQRVDRPYVRAYLRRPRPGERPDDWLRILLDRPLPHVVSVLVAGFVKVSPESPLARSLADRLVKTLHGTTDAIIYYRDTSPGLATWLATELKARTTITRTLIVHVPRTGRRAKR